MRITSTGFPENVIEIINPLVDSKILPQKEQTDVILNVLPNFQASTLGKLTDRVQANDFVYSISPK